MPEDHDAAQPGAEVDEDISVPDRCLANGGDDLVDAAGQIWNRAVRQIWTVGRWWLDTEHLVDPDIALEERNRQQTLEQRGAAQCTGFDLGACGERLTPKRVLHGRAKLSDDASESYAASPSGLAITTV